MLKISLDRTHGFNIGELFKLAKVVPHLERAMNSDELKDFVRFYPFHDDSGHSGLAIWERIQRGEEKGTNGDGVMNLSLEIAFRFNSVIGWTTGKSLNIWLNRRYFRSRSDASIGGTIAHEWLHKLGYRHSFKWTKSRKDSVPYAIGEKVAQLITEYQRHEAS